VGSHPYPGTALDYLIASYAPGRLDGLAELIDADPALVNQRFPELDCGMTGGRCLTLQGGTLLHVAVEYGNLAAAALLLDRGADVNAGAIVNDAGVGGHPAIFHAVTQFEDGGLPVTQLLIERGADLGVRARLPGDYDRPGEIVECTALGYALLFGGDSQRRTVTVLREAGAPL
jgi:ankyrin repeat protein